MVCLLELSLKYRNYQCTNKTVKQMLTREICILKVSAGSASTAAHAGVLKLSPASHLTRHFGETRD